MDDCYINGRNATTGRLTPDPVLFGGEQGMKELSAYVHAKGLKFGIYTDRGSETCEHRAGSRYHEAVDAQTYADWEVDFVKEDSCAAYQNPDKAIPEYSLMRDALNATGRPIFFSLCGWQSWYAPPMPALNYTGGYSLANSARINRDDTTWAGVLASTDVMAHLTPYARPGYWNDPDLLLSIDYRGRPRVSELQSRAQFSLWAVLSAPLIISGDFSKMSAFTMATYSNAAAIAINQNGGVQGSRLAGPALLPCFTVPNATNCTNVFGKRMPGATWALVIVNAGKSAAQVGCNSSCLGALSLTTAELPLRVTDAWSGASSLITTLAIAPTELPPEGGHRLLTLQAQAPSQ